MHRRLLRTLPLKIITPHTEFVKSAPPKLHPKRSITPDTEPEKVIPDTDPEKVTPKANPEKITSNTDPENVTPSTKGYLGHILDGGLLLALLLLALLLRGRPRLPLHRRFEMLRFGLWVLATNTRSF